MGGRNVCIAALFGWINATRDHGCGENSRCQMITEEDIDADPEVLDLSMRGWRTLDEVALDPKARLVKLEHNNLVNIPSSIGTLTLMTQLDISHNALDELPAEIGMCRRLRILHCNNNKLSGLPSALSDCQFLEEVVASHNRIVTIPSSLGQLEHLRIIKVDHNRLETLPYEIGGVETLDTLDCSHNSRLRIVPECLRENADMVRFTIRLLYQMELHAQKLKNENKQLQVRDPTAFALVASPRFPLPPQSALFEQEEQNLRIRDAIEAVQLEKQNIVASMLPGASLVTACVLM